MAGDWTFVEENVFSTANWNGYVRDQSFTICTSSTRPGSPVTGRRIFETDTGHEYVYYGSAWVLMNGAGAWQTYTPTWYASGVQPAIGNGTLAGRYRRIGRTIVSHLSVIMGSTTTYGTGYWYFSSPGGLTYNNTHQGVGVAEDGGSWYPLTVVFASTYITPYYTNAGTLSTISSTAPFTWGSGDMLRLTSVVEIA